MADFLKKLQAKPKHIRKLILWIIVIILALILGSWWIYSSYWKIKNFPKEEIIKKLELPQFKELK